MTKWILALLLVPAAAAADVPRILAAQAHEGRFGWRFDVTVLHDDAGREHYAEAWSVHLPDGTMLGERQLLHPHLDEQPFTRSLFDVYVPEGTTVVILRGRDNVHGTSEDFVYRLPGT